MPGVARRHAPWWLAGVFVLLAAGFGTLAYQQGYGQFRLSHYGQSATGEVTAIQKGLEPQITVRFNTRDGRSVEGHTKSYVGPVQLGDEIRIRYDRAHPTRMQAQDWGTDFSTGLLYGGIAVALAGVALLCAIGRAPRWLWG